MILDSDRSLLPVNLNNEVIGASEPSFPKEKILRDLKEGMRLRDVGGYSTSELQMVVTRFGDDLFTIDADNYSRDATVVVDAFSRSYCDIHRRQKLPFSQGSAYLEKWGIQIASTRSPREDYRVQAAKGGELDKREFLRRYNLSVVDAEATREYVEAMREKLAVPTGRRWRMSWVSEATIPTDRSLVVVK